MLSAGGMLPNILAGGAGKKVLATGTSAGGAGGELGAGAEKALGGTFSAIIITGAVPAPIKSIAPAAASDKSMILDVTKGPVSFMRTVTWRMFCKFTTVSTVPWGRVL